MGGGAWNWLPELFDASILSDEATAPGAPNFTGAFVGMACQDMSGTAHAADFDWFEYRERGYQRAVEVAPMNDPKLVNRREFLALSASAAGLGRTAAEAAEYPAGRCR